MKNRANVLYTTPILRYFPDGGPELRIDSSIKAICSIANVSIVSRASSFEVGGGDKAVEYYNGIASSFSYTPSVRYLSKNRYIRKVQKVLFSILSLVYDQDLRFILKTIDRDNINVIWFGFGNISYPLIRKIRKCKPNIKIVCDTDSVWSRFLLRSLPYLSGKKYEEHLKDGLEKEREEVELLKISNIVTAVSQVDASYYKEIGGNESQIKIFSNAIDFSKYQDEFQSIDIIHPCIYLAGTFGGPMNVATQWILDDVMPIIIKKIPEIHLYIIGKGGDVIFGHLNSKNITVTGWVDSTIPYLVNANVSIVPLKFESGTRFKILEAAACKTPLVSTTLGAEGIPVSNGKHILIADDPVDFANSVCFLIANKYESEKIASRCYELIKSKYNIKNLVDEATEILNSVSNN